MRTLSFLLLVGFIANISTAEVTTPYLGGLKYLFAYLADSDQNQSLGRANRNVAAAMIKFYSDPDQTRSAIERLKNLYSADPDSPTRLIANIQDLIFNGKNLRDAFTIETNLINLRTSLKAHNLSPRIMAWYVADEPYAVARVTRETLEGLLTKVHTILPGKPTYIIFAQHCFDPEANTTNGRCNSPLVPELRGIPRGLDWVGFDWYSNWKEVNYCNGVRVNGTKESFDCRIRFGMSRLKKLTGKPIILVADGTSQFLFGDAGIQSEFKAYLEIARSEPQVMAVDLFIWANSVPTDPPLFGILSFPEALALVKKEGQFLLCDKDPLGFCPKGVLEVPAGPFAWRDSVSGLRGIFISFEGGGFCSISTTAIWNAYSIAWFGEVRSPGSTSIRSISRLPATPFLGLCR